MCDCVDGWVGIISVCILYVYMCVDQWGVFLVQQLCVQVMSPQILAGFQIY